MRTLTATLLAAQKLGRNPLYRVVLTKSGGTSYTYQFIDSPQRILPFTHYEQPYTQKAGILLNNGDKALTGVDFKGYTATLSYGYTTTAGNEYSATAPLKVIDQQNTDNMGRLSTYLNAVGIMDLMDRDEASESYLPEKTDSKTVQTILKQIAGDSSTTILPCFSHCTTYDVVFDSTDSIITSYKPGNSYRIMEGGSRLDAWRRALRVTGCVSRIQNDGKIHVFAPTVSGTGYDASYSLAAGAHVFFSKAYRSRIPDPAYVSVKSLVGEAEYSGFAQDTNVPVADRRRRFYRQKVISNAQATSIAEAILQHAQLDAEQGSGSVPMDCGAEVCDWINVVDSREGDNRTGNIGQLQRYFAPRQFNMDFRFGGIEARMPLSAIDTADTAKSGLSPEALAELYKAINDLYDNQAQMITFTNKLIDYINRDDWVIARLQVKEQLIIPAWPAAGV